PKDDMWACLKGIINQYKNPNQPKPENFREWIMQTFGEGLADIFMIPYNFKVWAFPPEMMNYKWIGERVAITDLEKVTHNILYDKEDISWGPNNTFQFPKNGGTGAIWLSVANLIGQEYFHLGKEVSVIDND